MVQTLTSTLLTLFFFFLQKVLTSFSYLASQPTATRSSKIKRGRGAREMDVCFQEGYLQMKTIATLEQEGGDREIQNQNPVSNAPGAFSLEQTFTTSPSHGLVQ